MSYLGLSLGAPFKSQAAWNVVQYRLNRRLVCWKKKKRENCLKAQGTRLTLIKSALSNLSIYYMSLFAIPKVVKYLMEKLKETSLGEESPSAIRCVLSSGA